MLSPRRATLATAILLLIGPGLRADDGTSRDRLKKVLADSAELIRSLVQKADKDGEQTFRLPADPLSMSRDLQADAVRAIGRRRPGSATWRPPAPTWQSSLDTAADTNAFSDATKRGLVFVQIAEAQFEAGDRDEPRFTIRRRSRRSGRSGPSRPFPGSSSRSGWIGVEPPPQEGEPSLPDRPAPGEAGRGFGLGRDLSPGQRGDAGARVAAGPRPRAARDRRGRSARGDRPRLGPGDGDRHGPGEYDRRRRPSA